MTERIGPPVPVMEAPKTLRQTWLRTLDKCPHSAYLALKHDGGLDSHPLFRGRAFHETVERATRACLTNGEVTIDQHTVKAILQEVLLEHEDWVVPASEMDDLRMMVYHWAESFECPVGALVEQRFHLEAFGRVVSGTVDLCWVEGGTLHIRDYKTGRGLPPQDDVAGKDPDTGSPRGAKAAQLIIYALLICDGHPVGSSWQLPGGVNRVDARLVFPFFNTDDGLVERGLVIERPELIEHREWLEVLLRRAEAGFDRGVWPAVPGSQCSVCPAPQECPVPAVLRQSQGISPYERDPGELAEEYLFLSMDASRMQKELKAYAEQHGPIPIGSDQELSHKRVDAKRLTKEGKERRDAGLPVRPGDYKESVSTRFDVRPVGTGF